MDDYELTADDERVLAALKSGFPVSQSPYCDLGVELGLPEIDVLNTVGRLRELGAIARIAVVFSAPDEILGGESPEAAALAELVSFDLPWSEHPYAETAAELELRGIEQDEAGVIDLIREWLVDGAASGVVALTE